ncbi:MAG: PAS domain-containing protein [Deltaproteobacteria bacterium]|nr:PAS domain-containing protein [Deltaproteobacteria bacterium]
MKKRARKQPLKGQSPEKGVPEPVQGEKEGDEGVFPVVGIGASAGGVEALTLFLKELPPKTGMAYVFVQHLAPDKLSMLPEIISRATEISVLTAQDAMAVEPDHIYIIPPGYDMSIFHGKLALFPVKDEKRHMPVDYFFRSLARDSGGKSIGVVLSGTGSDGTAGLLAIKGEGGLTFAEKPETAKFDGMPRSAINSGSVDFVKVPGEIARELARIASHPYVLEGRPALLEDIISQDGMAKVFYILRNATGVDFTYYKPSTIKRRIKRRMVLHRIERTEDYLQFAQSNPAEVEALFQDLLINVTSFFRDPDSFEVLKKKVFPEIMKDRPPETPVRIWVPACSTGEEAYSIAMTFFEFLGEKAGGTAVQIFATDIDEKALDKARLGKYQPNIAADVSPERLRRFFVRSDGDYQIGKVIREACAFARHNLLKDPPFSKIDLISCRNLLIYLGPQLQKKVLPLLHYALNPVGFLMLGTSETIGQFADLFSTVDKNEKIYCKKSVHARVALPIALSHRVEVQAVPDTTAKKAMPAFDVIKEADRIVMSKYAPPSLVINSDMEVVKFSGKTGEFIEHAAGEASLNLFRMVREGLLFDLRKSLSAAAKDGAPQKKEGIEVKTATGLKKVDLEVIPIKDPYTNTRNYIVIFEEAEKEKSALRVEPDEKAKPGSLKKTETAKDREIAELRQELAATKEHLQSIIEVQESMNEDLRVANEEIQASNEELQSTNEELETAKEELQSTNEELVTVNDELENRNSELSRLNDDLNNLVSSVNMPVVILERDLKIRRFTPPAQKIMKLIPTDVGRPLSDIMPSIDIKDLDELVADVIDTVTIKMKEVQDGGGRWWSMRIHPYLTSDKRVDGAVLIFIDIDESRRVMQKEEEDRVYFEGIVSALRRPIAVLDENMEVISASGKFYETFRVEQKETVGNSFFSLGNRQWDIPELRERVNGVIAKEESFYDFAVEHDFARVGRKRMLLSGSLIKGKTRRLILIEIGEVC